MQQTWFTATGIVFNAAHDILLVHHKRLDRWLPPGGQIHPGERADQAVLREIFEETGVRAALIPNKRSVPTGDTFVLELNLPFAVLAYDMQGTGQHNCVDSIFLCRATDDAATLVPQEAEVQAAGWFTFAQLGQLNTFDNVIQTVAQALAHLGISHE